MPRKPKRDRWDGVHRRDDRGGRLEIQWRALDPELGKVRTYRRLLDASYDEDAAVLERAKARKAATGGRRTIDAPAEKVTLNHFQKQYLEAHKNQKDYPNKRHRIQSRILPALGSRPLASLTPQDFRDFATGIIGDAKGPDRAKREKTANRYSTVLRHMIGWACDEELLPDEVLVRARKAKLYHEGHGRVIFFYKPDALKLVKAASDPKVQTVWKGEPRPIGGYLLPLILLGLGTGIRRGDLFNLKWKDIDRRGGVIWVGGESGKDTKGGEGYEVPIGPIAKFGLERARAWLAVNKKPAKDGDWVVDWRGRDRLRFLFGIDYPAVRKAAGLDQSMTFHVLRHTFGSWALANGADLAQVKKWMGHSMIATTEKYLHAVERGQKAKWTSNPLAPNTDRPFRRICHRFVTKVISIDSAPLDSSMELVG